MLLGMNTKSPSSDPPLDPANAIVMLRGAIGQIQFARQYSLQLITSIPQDRWFEIPNGLSTHLAWQVGHLAVSQYGLLMFRIRGRHPDDLELIPGKFRKAYTRQSVPSTDPLDQPSPRELIEKLETVYQRAMEVLQNEILEPENGELLLEPIDLPYAGYPNKLGAILFCPLHEHIHAGQIGVIRRSLGMEPIR